MASAINVGDLGNHNPSTESIKKNFDLAASEISALQARADTLETQTIVSSVGTVAAAGTDQAGATALVASFELVTGANGTAGVKLPAAVAKKVMIVKNNANAVLKVYPGTDDAINAAAANAAIDMAAYTSCIFVAYDATTWYSIPLVAS